MELSKSPLAVTGRKAIAIAKKGYFGYSTKFSSRLARESPYRDNTSGWQHGLGASGATCFHEYYDSRGPKWCTQL